MAKLQASVDDRILTSDFESVFRNGGRLPSSSEDIFFAFDERPPGAPFEYRFRLDAVETGASSVSPVDFFGTDDLPKVQRWLQELNSEVELLGAQGAARGPRRTGFRPGRSFSLSSAVLGGCASLYQRSKNSGIPCLMLWRIGWHVLLLGIALASAEPAGMSE
eukprot:CAMPEP_0183313304 /NCGR_PEP_ID=MMETSP0160_2-20130417/44840_1 /TAXON_ID=2839 ORGANISM="Odontella Sinensis, Strain Grunow 1884" /NCGR_SAMPLE_ID=MMETSP0160_2 /ASSEMBLY_ACC=CAM_ASM_000250 /LENGTH=162 /DNA_ID=CAMNT_0025478357 /DNA_START=166 /DNA_END=655 /DNA_ORIENTATION=+